jgi:hypothetical protein
MVICEGRVRNEGGFKLGKGVRTMVDIRLDCAEGQSSLKKETVEHQKGFQRNTRFEAYSTDRAKATFLGRESYVVESRYTRALSSKGDMRTA